jgi:hypothetical protein
MNKTKVLVFTCYDKWSINIPGSVKKPVPEWNDLYPDKEHPIKECVFNPECPTPNTLEDVVVDSLVDKTGVFLVYDDINPKGPLFKKLKQCDGQDLYILAHTTGKCKPECFAGWDAFVLEGSHQPDSKLHYTPLFAILTDNVGNKLNRIIDTVFKPYNKLEVVLQFLHGCLVPNNDDDSFESAYIKLLANNDIKADVEDFYVNTYSKQQKNDSDYQKALSQLRDTLLNYALTIPKK